jgi:hypothetical protein
MADIWKVLAVLAVLVLAVRALRRRNKSPVRFKSYDEYDLVSRVADWGTLQIDKSDPRRKTLLQMASYLSAGGWNLTPSFMMCLSVQELRAVQPFIDEWIVGKAPPLNLPAEYEDDRSARLKEFKSRMIAEGLWQKKI